ncbi:MAG: citrate transporter [Bacteroidota bacterium]
MKILHIGLIVFLLILLTSLMVIASGGNVPKPGGIRIEFFLFGLTLVGIAVFHKKTMLVALIGLVSILLVKIFFDDSFDFSEHFIGTTGKTGEWRTLLNLAGLLFGFAILAKLFETSGLPDILPGVLPDDWRGGFVLLIFIFILSTFLDNIAAAMIGGTIAVVVFHRKLHIGYLAAIIAASNAGGAGSVVGDTTTTLMWIEGISPVSVLPAFIAGGMALLVFGIISSVQQDRFFRIQKDPSEGVKINRKNFVIVLSMLTGAILTNYFMEFPAAGLWAALLLGTLLQKVPWSEIKKAWKGTVFLIALVTSASLMPVNDLPDASWKSTFILGFVSAAFDNIPLTKLCLEQGGYDWGMLAYAVGFGGSMIWFGSSAGVALSNSFPEARSVVSYIRNGWHVILAYIAGFFLLFGLLGWNPS